MDIRLCAVVLGELLYGVHHSPPCYQSQNASLLSQLRRQFDSLPFDDRAAEEYGKLRADLAAQGSLIGPNFFGGVTVPFPCASALSLVKNLLPNPLFNIPRTTDYGLRTTPAATPSPAALSRGWP